MDDSTNPAMRALARRLAPRVGTMTCRVPVDDTMRLHGEPCKWRGTSDVSAARHFGAVDKADERDRGVKMTGRRRGQGHNHVTAKQATMRDTIGATIGTIRAEAAVAAEEESE